MYICVSIINWTLGSSEIVLSLYVIHSGTTAYRCETKSTRHDQLKRDHHACGTYQQIFPYTKYNLINYSKIV